MSTYEKYSESGFPIKQTYTAADWSTDPDEALGLPGGYPYTRHVRRAGYTDRPWAPSLYAGFGDPSDANARFQHLLANGNGRVSIAFDLPTQLGMDSDDPRAQHDVGRVGVAIDSLADFEELLEGIPLEQVPVTMNINGMSPVMTAMLTSVARKQGADFAKLRGTVSNDILHEFASRGLYVYDVETSLDWCIETADFVLREMPNFFAFNVRAALLHETGANPAQEIGYSFEIAACYIEALLKRGLEIDQIAPRLSLFFATSQMIFEDAAKLRAARRMWAKRMVEQYGSTDPRSQGLRMTAVACAGSHFTREEPTLNLARSTLGVLGAALGGAQTMVGTAIDEAFEIPTQHTQDLALGVQRIVAKESDVCVTVDPLGGSYFVESLTDATEAAAKACGREVHEWGGILRALEDQQVQDAMRERAFRIHQEIESGERTVVGRNDMPVEAEEVDVHHSDETVLPRRVAALEKVRSTRDQATVDAALRKLREVRFGEDPVMEVLVEAVEAYATIGELREAMRREERA
ncbi:acyl-CoA mutase large subunit family protein [Nocardioides sp. LHD-245]|uniref:acyl-CoA mutase large subunit family protein n=1 Tax=Nocardioides sp. LHD-245 TaxID=3051387 RepID=UPI0027E02DF9|nr:acyl-CoA mutase large subunit family protein [Nocardioides sp. LHD-245]